MEAGDQTEGGGKWEEEEEEKARGRKEEFSDIGLNRCVHCLVNRPKSVSYYCL